MFIISSNTSYRAFNLDKIIDVSIIERTAKILEINEDCLVHEVNIIFENGKTITFNTDHSTSEQLKKAIEQIHS